ncbi:MAG: DUF1934 domain-containing protein [Firmicutes bacterium]|jgi:uncharacterized beta-barrel protein YwiB (DUF1934 family)|nr:DUF1934 domain-containing protein [Bacillota bacterium]MBV1727532.1 DUF1934 domain-containing protein [Desulforudis sp.]MDZ7609948.1 DUF1934 domain-containing protein [Eubacteriales bacterium]MBU4534164.1 DUF1934 domain-containing protein [Bacillota bacterium]MBU4553410.1 DUF1934 domain-containing protein [Bacillota bacterium]
MSISLTPSTSHKVVVSVRKEVWVTLRSVRTDDLGEDETVELATRGDFYRRKDCFYIIYNESEASGQAGTTTSWKAEPSRVILNKVGTSEVRQVFEYGIHDRASYITPYGMLPVAVLPWKVEVDLTEVGGSINLEYELEMDRQKIGYQALSITVEEV